MEYAVWFFPRERNRRREQHVAEERFPFSWVWEVRQPVSEDHVSEVLWAATCHNNAKQLVFSPSVCDLPLMMRHANQIKSVGMLQRRKCTNMYMDAVAAVHQEGSDPPR